MPISSLHHAKSNGTSLFAVLSLNILQSLDEDKIQKLADLNIYSIGDLLHYKPILHSQILMAISNREIGHDIELEQYLSNTFVNTPLSQIPDLKVSSIINVSSTDENILNTAFNVIKIRDLAQFQPFIEAQMYLNDDQEVFNEPASAPEDLMPKIIGSTSTIARFNNFIKDDELVLNTKFTISNPADGANAELYNIFHTKYPKLAFGLIAGFKQEWVNMGTHLGEVIHSLALAPGESVNIVKIDWYRRESSRRSENTIVDEKLSSNLVHTRALNEVVKTTAREHLFGETSLDAATKNSGFGLTASAASASSESGSISGDLGILGIPLKIVGSFIKSVAGAIGISAVYSKNKQTGTLTSTSDGLREVVGSLQQNINEATVQNSSNVRSLYSTVIVTDQQQETENINTRTVTNYNHSHALTIQYYEVLQRYEIINKLEKWEPIVFVPFKPIDFNIDIIKKYWFILKGPIKENFSEKYEIYNQFITNFSGTNPEFDLNGNIVVEKIKFNLSGYSSGPYIHYSFGQSFTAQEPQRHIEVSINQPAIVSKLVVNSPSDIITNRPLSDFDTLNMGWSPPMSPKTPTNSNSQCSIHINLEFTLKDEESRSTVVTMSYSRTMSYLELYQMSFSPILIKNNLEVEIRNQLDNLSNITNTDLQEEIIQHFTHNKYAYTRFLLSSIESDQLIDIIESISWMANGTNFNLTNYIHPSPLAISENYLMFSPRKMPKEYRGDLIWQKISSLNSLLSEYKKSNANRIKDTVFLPTAGVFAEAILGRSNASEFVDPRRFWNWQDSPIPFSAPQIAALQAGNHVVSDSSSELIPNIPASNLNIINPPQYPLPNALASAFQAVQNGNMFRDMAGSANLGSILGNLANLANNTATLAGNLSGQAAENALNGAIELGKQVAGMVNKAEENWGSMNSIVARPPQNPTEKAGLLNTIEDVNKRNPKNENYTPKEKAVLVSQGFDYDSLIASNDPNFSTPQNINTCSNFFDYNLQGGLRFPMEIEISKTNRVFLTINSSNFSIDYCFSPTISMEEKYVFISIMNSHLNDLAFIGEPSKKIINLINTSRYVLSFDTTRSSDSLWLNTPLKATGDKFKQSEFATSFLEINRVKIEQCKRKIAKIADSISKQSGIQVGFLETELRLSGLYVEILHIMQYELEYELETYYQRNGYPDYYIPEIIWESPEAFGKMYGYQPNETRSMNLLNEQIRAIINFRLNKGITLDANVLRPIECARKYWLNKNITVQNLADCGIIFDPENEQLITNYNLNPNDCYCSI